MATEHWIAGSGVGLSWTSCFSTEVNSLGIGYSVLSGATAIANGGSVLDMFADFSCSVASVIVPAGIPFIGVYLIPLNQDGTSYGDGIPGTTGAANTPASSYFIGNIPAPVGTQAVTGMLQRIIIPPGTFKFAIYNGLGVAFTSSSNTFAYRTYNRSVL